MELDGYDHASRYGSSGAVTRLVAIPVRWGLSSHTGVDSVTIAVYAVSVTLAVLSMLLFVLAARRLLGRQEEIVATMLGRYDDRLAEFAQTLNDALALVPVARPSLAEATGEPGDHGVVMRTLEIARERTDAHAAVAVVASASQSPTLATVGLSQAEAAHVGRMGFPDYRVAAPSRSRSTARRKRPPGDDPIRSGLVVPLLSSDTRPGMLAVLTRSADRRFSETDINVLEHVVENARSALGSSLALHPARSGAGARPPYGALRPASVPRPARPGDRPGSPRTPVAVFGHARHRPA